LCRKCGIIDVLPPYGPPPASYRDNFTFYLAKYQISGAPEMSLSPEQILTTQEDPSPLKDMKLNIRDVSLGITVE
jgi:hypothetical protein